MSYKGRYTPINPKKYKGNPSRIIYRSLWERKFMIYCDTNNSVLEWGSEEIIIPYLSPWDSRIHRYFPDFYIKIKQKNGSIKRMIIEIKPKNQCKPPTKTPKKRTKKWYKEVKTWGINEAKWKSATKWCEDQDMEFKILNEDHLDIRYK
tara:strand:+ start:4772 stop:5218 length:447 start_codon:yes stop_codon:yes gene_type:complete